MAKLNLKGFDFKAFFLDHGEKIAFGVFALITLLVLATSAWSRYPKSPEEIIVKVNDAKQKFVVSSRWKPEQAAGFALQDFMQKTHEVQGPLSLSRYEYSTPLWHPLYRKQELAKEPEWMMVIDLDARAGQFTLGLAPKGLGNMASEMLADAQSSADGSSAAGSATKPAATAGLDDEFAPATRTPGAAAGAMGAGTLAGAMGAAGLGGGAHGAGGALTMPTGTGTRGSAGGAAGGHSSGGGASYNPFDVAGMSDGTMGGMTGGMGMSAGGLGLECRGERFVAVRGIFPLQQQLEKIQRALNLGSRNEARAYLVLQDFVLERQTAVAGSDPWAGPWETVDITRANEVLDEAFDYDFDTILPEIINETITMPLPARIRGKWGDLATHPKIKNFELTGDEQKKMQALEDKLIEEFDKMRLKEESRTKQRGGFAKRSRNLQQMASTMYGSNETSNMFEQALREDNTFAQNPMFRMSKEEIRARLTSPADRVLLFRYFDFDVRPGYAYRYRVKLVVHNPNENRPVDQVVVPEVAQGESRETPWSKESNAAVVPESVHYFLQSVDRDLVNETKSGKKTLASFRFFEWDATKGTRIADTIQLSSAGQFVGEKKKSLHLDVAKPYFKDEEVTFRSDDVFLDGEGDLQIPVEEHKDLKIPSQNRRHIGMLPAAIVIDRSGELVALDPTPNTSTERQLKDVVERERAYYQDIKNKDEKDKPSADGAMPFGGSADMESMAAQMLGIKGKKGKPKLKPNAAGSAGGSSSMSR